MILAFFGTLFRWRSLLIILALAAISALIWFLGPLISIGEFQPFASLAVRVTIITTLFVGAFLIALIRFIIARRRNAKLIKSLMKTDDLAPAFGVDDEVATIRQRFEEAMGVLRTSTLDSSSGKAYFSDLPWYIIIGPPGTGKTTIFRNSGLEFPLAEKLGGDALQGISGTRNCDWWITDEAVLIDTAGRYSTQDVNRDVDQAAWLGFLDILKRARRRRPVNGVMLAISATDLASRSEQERKRFADVMRRRIQELLTAFEVRIPVYILVTKCDLISGFNEYFADMDDADRQQVWGMTFGLEDEGRQPTLEFGERFNQLVERLDAGLPERLHLERDLSRRCKIYTFVEEFASLGPLFADFIDDVFKQNRFERQPLLRGLYFTSGTQEGTPVERLVGAFSRTFGLASNQLAPYTGRGRAYFIRRVLTDVIFPEQGLIGSNRKLERRLVATQAMGYAASAVLLVGGILFGIAHANAVSERVEDASQLADQMESRYEQVDLPTVPLESTLDVLNSASALVEETTGSSSLWPWTAITDPRTPALEEEAREAYDRVLINSLLKSASQRLANQLSLAINTPGEQGNGAIRRYLPAYLMLGDPGRYQSGPVRRVFAGEVQSIFPLNPENQTQMTRHMDDLLALLPHSVTLDQNLVRAARQRLATIPQSDQVYALLVREAGQSPNLRPINLLTVVGNNALQLRPGVNGQTVVQVDGLYTRQGFYNYFLTELPRLVRESLGDDWVAGQINTNSDAYKQLVASVSDLYVRDYINVWNQAVSQVTVVDFNDLNRGLSILQELAKPDSPLQQLVQTVQQNTVLPIPDQSGTPPAPGTDPAAAAAAQAAAGGGGVTQAASDLLNRAQGTGAVGLGLVGDNWPGKPIEAAFKPVNDLLANTAGGPGSASISRVQQLMGQLYGSAGSIATAPDPNQAAYNFISQQTQSPTSNAIGLLRQEGPIYPQPFQQIMPKVAQSTTAAIMRQAFIYVNGVWQSEIIPICNATIAGRYPLARDAAQEVTLDDFANVFRPTGVIDGFFKDYLTTFIVKRGGRLTPATFGGLTLNISRETIAQFERAESIKTTFFADGGTTPSLKFSITPALLDATALRSVFSLDGTDVVYRHEPPRTSDFTWPNKGAASTASIEIRYTDGSTTKREATGVWALFRLLDASGIARQSQADYAVSVTNADGKGVRYDLRAASVNNAFDLGQLAAFRCPDAL